MPFFTSAFQRATSSRALAWLLVALYCLLIFLQSAFPAPDNLPGIPGLDKLAHLAIYLVLGLLFAHAYTLSLPRILPAHWLLLLAWLSATLYGATDEVHQAFVAARSADIVDWLANAVGAALGARLYLHRRR
ncbi:MAG: VanZ family protein [Desulfosarcinaceae bacterium]|nr:VanZ family protein [Desulfosarcinaceae bacterium]